MPSAPIVQPGAPGQPSLTIDASRAVDLSKVSLWLVTLAKEHALTFVDHALKCGDSLVGLSAAQIERFEWTPDPCGETTFGGRPLTPCAGVIEDALLQACAARRKLHELAELTADPVAIVVGVKARLQDDASRRPSRSGGEQSCCAARW